MRPVQALRDPVETTAASTSVEIRLHSSQSQVDATILDKHLVITGYDQSGLPKVTNYVAYEQYYDSAEWTVQTRGIHVIVLDRSTVRKHTIGMYADDTVHTRREEWSRIMRLTRGAIRPARQL